jgi:hypothetical protein
VRGGQALIPRVGRMMVGRTGHEWCLLLDRLDACGILQLADEADLHMDGFGACDEPDRATVFAVAKDAGADRSIVNRSSRNGKERSVDLVRHTFPHGVLLCETSLKHDEVFRASSDDLADYYHQCRVSRARAVSNAVGDMIPISRARRWASWRRFVADDPDGARRAEERGFVQPLWGVLPMGDRNAVDYSQTAHVNVLRSAGLMRESEMLVYGRKVPTGDTLEGVMVDDHVVLQKVSRAETTASAKAQAVRREESCTRGIGTTQHRDEEILARSRNAYERVQLQAKASKASRYESERAEFWGAHLAGRRGAVRAKDEIAGRAAALTVRILELGWCSVGLFLAVLGLWTHVLMFRRPGFALFHHVSRVGRGCGMRDVVHVPTLARGELLTVLAFSSLWETDLRAEWSSEVSCVDASSAWGAVVCTRVGGSVVSQLGWEHRYRAGGYIRCGSRVDSVIAELSAPGASKAELDLLLPLLADDVLEDAFDSNHRERSKAQARRARTAERWFSDYVRSVGWRVALRWRFGKATSKPHSKGRRAAAGALLPLGVFDEHINVKELKAHCADVRRRAAGATTAGATRYVCGKDSLVARGAVVKGRSSSWCLNTPLRRSLPDTLFGRLYSADPYVPSEFNPADAPTRNRKVQRRVAVREPWVHDAAGGLGVDLEVEYPPLRGHRLSTREFHAVANDS